MEIPFLDTDSIPNAGEIEAINIILNTLVRLLRHDLLWQFPSLDKDVRHQFGRLGVEFPEEGDE